MSNQLYIPRLNPVQFVEVDYIALPQYLSRHMDDYWFREQHTSQFAYYSQKWSTHDGVILQFEANFGPITSEVLDCNGTVILSQTATLKRTHKYLPSFFVYELVISWATIALGTYFIVLTLPGGVRLVSEPQEIAYDHPGTQLYEYRNSTYHGDIIWETGFYPNFRIESRLARMDPGTERTAYRDQQLNPSILKARPFRTWDLVTDAVPDWVREKLNWIFSCDEVKIDGKLYAVFEDSKWEPGEIDPMYPLQTTSLKVQEGLNRASKITTVGIDPNKRILVGIPVDGTVFGDLSSQAGSNLVIINAIE